MPQIAHRERKGEVEREDGICYRIDEESSVKST